MTVLSVATTINQRFDHVTPIEATQSSVTITHRCHVFAELMAVARSGLVDIVLIADDLELVGLETLQQVLDTDGSGPKVVAISDLLDDRRRLAELGIPVVSPSLSGPELVAWLREAHRNGAGEANSSVEFSSADLQILEQLDPETEPKRRAGRRAAPYDPAIDLAADTEQTTVPVEELTEFDLDVAHSPTTLEAMDPPTPPVSPTDEAVATPVAENRNLRGHLTAVWGPSGSPGVTTVAVNLAVESVLSGHRTLLIDADTYGAAVAVHLGLLDDTAAIAQACRAAEHRGITADELAKYAQRVSIHGSQLDVITGLTRPERWPQLRAAAWNQLLDVARTGWEHIVVDCGFGLDEDEELSFDIPAPQRNATTIRTVTTADTVVAVGTGDPVGFPRFMKGLEHLTDLTSSPVVPVVNKVSAMTSGLGPKGQLATVWDRFGPKTPLRHFIPWAPEVTAAALFEGKTLAERASKSEVRYTIRQVAQSCVPAGVGVAPQEGSKDGKNRARRTLLRVVTRIKDRVGRDQESKQ